VAEAARRGGFECVRVERRAVAFTFGDAVACWRWWTAFPGWAGLLARRAPSQRAALRARFCAYLADWPRPLVTTLEVLMLRARA
jgi:hypothetical protein